MCAAVYVFGKYGNNTCPWSAKRIGSAEECKRAAIFMGLEWLDYPDDANSGCSANRFGGASYNKFDWSSLLNPVYLYERPLCAVGTCLPRIHARRAVRHGTNNVHAACPGTTEHPRPRPYGARPARLHDAAPTRPFSCTRRAATGSCATSWYPTTLQNRSRAAACLFCAVQIGYRGQGT